MEELEVDCITRGRLTAEHEQKECNGRCGFKGR